MGILGIEPSKEAQTSDALFSSQYRVLHLTSVEGREVDIIAVDLTSWSSFVQNHDPNIDIGVFANNLCLLCILEALTCRVHRAWRFGMKHGVLGGGGDPCGISQTFLHLAKSAHDLDRRGIRVNCGLSTCMPTQSRCHWSRNRSGLRDPVTVNWYSCLLRLISRGPESAVSTIALPNNKGQHTL